MKQKGANEYTVLFLIASMSLWGHGKVILKTEQEPSIMKLAEEIQKAREQPVILEKSP